VFYLSIHFNAILVVEGNDRAIKFNWEVNCAFQKFGGWIEKEVIVEGGKV
jgi:hypothetical protein